MNINLLQSMKHSPVRNYAVPGLTSWLIGEPSPSGCVRLFECEREHMEPIIPHSHRFDFQCHVLSGTVRNRIWSPSERGDQFCVSAQSKGRMGGYVTHDEEWARFCYMDTLYGAGHQYGMQHDEIHSIWFGRGTKVLFFEGPQVTETSRILQPVVDDKVVPTFKVEPWMFNKEAA